MSRGNIEALAPYDIVCLLREGNVHVLLETVSGSGMPRNVKYIDLNRGRAQVRRFKISLLCPASLDSELLAV